MSTIILKQLIQAYSQSNPHSLSYINFQNFKISKIGTIEKKITLQVKTLNLANNSLKSLDGIQQFQALQSLNISNNRISSSNEMARLKCLEKLKKVFFRGNSFLQKPLDQELIILLNSYVNDLQILNYALFDDQKQSHLSQNILTKNKLPPLSYSRPQSQGQIYDASPRIISPINKNNNKSNKAKVNMIMSKLQEEFIQQKQQSQQISNQSIDNDSQKPISIPSPITKQQSSMFKVKKRNSQLTPDKRSPQFGQYSNQKDRQRSIQKKAENQFNSMYKNKNRLFQESTRLKHTYNPSLDSNYIKQQQFYDENSSSAEFVYKANYSLQKSSNLQKKSPRQNSLSKASPEKRFKYQVSNMKINLQTDQPDLNYPSIIEKQDQNSYEIQFDFMSPSKDTQSKQISPTSKASPSKELKEITASYMKIQDGDQIQQNQQPKRSSRFFKQNSQKLLLFTNNKQTTREDFKNRQSVSPRSALSKTKMQISKALSSHEQVLSPLPQFSGVPRRKSLYESTRQFAPQKGNQNTYYQLLTKFISTHNNSKSFTRGQQISFNSQNQQGARQQQSFNSSMQIFSNQQNFQKFYYNSLIRLKPAFNLLYSPFYSLKVQQKDILLQQLFKNHKQIFMLLIKQFYSRQRLEQDINRKMQENYGIKVQNQKLKQKYFGVEDQINSQANRIQKLQKQNITLVKQLNKYEDIVNSREKLIHDVDIQYQKANKIVIKKDKIIQKYMNQDQIQQKIIAMRQKRIMKQYIDILHKKSQHLQKVSFFIKRRQARQKKRNQRNNMQIKKIIFQAFNYYSVSSKNLKSFISHKNQKIFHTYFKQWKTQTKLQANIKKIQKIIKQQAYKSFFENFNKLYLKSKRLTKTKEMYQIRIKRKVMQNIKKSLIESKQNQVSFLKKAIKFNHNKIISACILKWKQSIEKTDKNIDQNILKAKKVIFLNQCRVLLKLFKKIKKHQQLTAKKINQNIIYLNEANLFIRNLKSTNQNRLINSKHETAIKEYKLKKIFNSFKLTHKLQKKSNKKYSKLFRKLAHQARIKKLIVSFKQYHLQKSLDKQKILLFFSQFTVVKVQKQILSNKTQQLLSFLNFRRGFKSKYDVLMYLRYSKTIKQMQNRIKSLQQHYLLQQNKYKEGHQLNMVTIQSFKNQILNYLNQIQFLKIQIQKLSQRQLLIMEQKQNTLIDLKIKQQENIALHASIVQNSNKLQQLQRKYQKALDMYSQVIDQLNAKQQKWNMINTKQSLFLYDTIAKNNLGQSKNNIAPISFRKQNKQTTFTSLRR